MSQATPPDCPRHTVHSDVPGTPGQFWGDNTVYVSHPELGRIATKFISQRHVSRIREVLGGIRLFQGRRKADAFVTSGDLTGLTLGCLQTLFPWGRKPHVLIDCLGTGPPAFTLPLLRFFDVSRTSVMKYVVWASHEIEDYAEAFGVREDLFQYVHFWHTLGDTVRGPRRRICICRGQLGS